MVDESRADGSRARQMTVDVIVPVYNAEKTIEPCIRSILAAVAGEAGVSIIFVDNGSTDATMDMIRRDAGAVRLIEAAEKGSYAARNAGAAAGNGDYLLFTDGDCIVDGAWFRSFVAYLDATPQARLVAGPIILFDKPGDNRFAVKFEEIFDFNQAAAVRNNLAMTANLLVSRDLFRAIDGFDARLRSGGDSDFCLRATRHGATLEYCAEAIVRHPSRGTIGALVAKERRVVGGHWLRYIRSIKQKVLHPFHVIRYHPRRTRRIMATDLPFADKLGVEGVSLVITLAAAFEAVRLMLGGEPRRL
ncbi:MAG: glycosyltransferase family 2 protein [Labrys sp. (in: a-proteobacteria)]